MFHAARTSAFNSVRWEANPVEYIEAWNFSERDNCSPENFRHGVLQPDEVDLWLRNEGQFASPKQRAKLNGGLRLLICDRTSLHPPGFGISKDAFSKAETALNLHPATLPSFLVAGGTCSRHTERDSTASGKIKSISITIKAPQKYEIANYGLSLSFDVATGWTTALLFGESVTESSWLAKGYDPKLWKTRSPALNIRSLLEDSHLPMNHPLLLPCAIMADHLPRMESFISGDLTRDVMTIEHELGVTRVGRRSEYGMDGMWPGFRLEEQEDLSQMLDRPKAMHLTVRINTQYTRVLFSKRSPAWSQDASKFLLGMPEILPSNDGWGSHDDHQLMEMLQYNIDVAKSIEDHVTNLQSRMELQLNVLYSFVAQTDNRLSARIAAFSGRDSTSMKILAVITAAFLPGTYIATLFSMSMFNWQQNNSSGPGEVVSPRFWIYWAVTIPLTVLTFCGWATWWNFEKHRYDFDVSETLNSADHLDRPVWFKKLVKNAVDSDQDGSGDEKKRYDAITKLRHRMPWGKQEKGMGPSSEGDVALGANP